MNRIRTWAALAASLVTAALTALALAAPASAATPGCPLISTSCLTPVVAISATAHPGELTPANDFAMTYEGPSALGNNQGPVGVNFNNHLVNGRQDFSWSRIATVPPPGGGPGAFSFTGFDRHNYGLDGVYQAEYTPLGVDTNLCLARHTGRGVLHNHVVLQWCNGSRRQAWIFSPFSHGAIPGMNAPAAAPYGYVLNVPQSRNAQHHKLLTDPNPGVDDTLLIGSRGFIVPPGFGSGQQWAAIP
jgi:hypothetical protein